MPLCRPSFVQRLFQLTRQRLAATTQCLSTDLLDPHGDNLQRTVLYKSGSQRRQAVSRPCPRAGLVMNVEFAARRRPAGVDRAGDADTDFARERGAARRRRVGAAHAHDLRRHRDGHRERHAGAPGKGAAGQLGRMEVDTKGGTASAAGGAGTALAHCPPRRSRWSRRSTMQRYSGCPESRYLRSNGDTGSSATNSCQPTSRPSSRPIAKANSST